MVCVFFAERDLKIKCNSPVDCCWLGKGPSHTLIEKSLSLRTAFTHHLVCVFFAERDL